MERRTTRRKSVLDFSPSSAVENPDSALHLSSSCKVRKIYSSLYAALDLVAICLLQHAFRLPSFAANQQVGGFHVFEYSLMALRPSDRSISRFPDRRHSLDLRARVCMQLVPRCPGC
jgi:hypothetical protein